MGYHVVLFNDPYENVLDNNIFELKVLKRGITLAYEVSLKRKLIFTDSDQVVYVLKKAANTIVWMNVSEILV
ncbi:hypothetical protein ACS0TY_010497 [Phlomoides rotata]